MNIVDESVPRLTCRLARLATSVWGVGHGHVAHCAACQTWLAADDELAGLLRRDALAQHEPLPAGLEQRLLNAVHRSSSDRECGPAAQIRPERRVPPSIFALAGLGLAAALAMVYVQKTSVPVATAAHSEGDDAAVAVAMVKTLPTKVWSSISPATSVLAREEPLQTEVDAVYADARSALAFLKLNFLPTQARSG